MREEKIKEIEDEIDGLSGYTPDDGDLFIAAQEEIEYLKNKREQLWKKLSMK
jgi:hypothetical protein